MVTQRRAAAAARRLRMQAILRFCQSVEACAVLAPAVACLRVNLKEPHTALDTQAEFRQAAIACLSRRLHASLTSAGQQAAAETNALLETQTKLTQRGAHLRIAVSDYF